MARKGRRSSCIAEKAEYDVCSNASHDNTPRFSDACASRGDESSVRVSTEQAEEDEDDDEQRDPVHQAKASALESSARAVCPIVSRETTNTATGFQGEHFPRSQENPCIAPAAVASSSAASAPNRENSQEMLAESVMFPCGSSRNSASLDTQSDRRLISAAATIGGTAGMLLMGPVSGVALGTAAAYATTRDSRTGIVARNASALYLQVSDRAVDKGLQAVDRAVDEGCRRIYKAIDPSNVPAPLRPVLQTLTDRPGAMRTANVEEARQMRLKYPDRVPVLCEKSPYSNLPEISKRKFVVPGTMLCGEFKYIVHKLVLEACARYPTAEQTIYIFVKGITPKTSTPMSELYEQLRAADGFLHVRYCAENTLG